MPIDMEALLELAPAIRTGMKFPNGTYKSERHFLDFVIDGQSLWSVLGKSRDLVSVLCGEYVLDETMRAVNRLLLAEKADLPNDRRSIFICSECGDLGCGAITAMIVREGSSITWKDFGCENTYEEKIWLDDYRSVGPFTFHAISYERTLVQAVDRLKTGAI